MFGFEPFGSTVFGGSEAQLVGPGPDPNPEVPDTRNYAWLQAEVIDWMRRPDLASRVPKFIALAEADLSPRLQARGVEVDVPMEFAPGVGAKRLPDGFSSPLAAWLETGDEPRELTAVVPEQMSGTKDRGDPTYWAIDGTYLALDRPAARAQRVSLRYRGLLRLSDEAPNNSVLSKYHNVYLYGALKYSALHIRDMELAGTWSGLYEAAIKEMNRNESRSRAIAPLRTELAGLLGCR